MTASLSLRDSPKISAPTRARVREVAQRLGYRPDAEIARLMGKLKASRMVRRSIAIALIDLQAEGGEAEHYYIKRLRKGVVTRADALGFSVDSFRLRDYADDARKMMRVVRSRGIAGGILLPTDRPVRLPKGIWGGFSVVSATSAVLAPRFHCVVPNQLYNTMALIERMHERGYRKVGAIITESLEQRTAHCYSLALIWHGHGGRILILEDGVPPEAHEKRIAEWLEDHAVDVIFAQNAEVVARTLRSGARKVGLVSLSTIEPGTVAYQDEMPDYIGESAVSLLVGMMHNNETDEPEHPRVTTVDGKFRDAASVRRPKRARAKAAAI
jgi:DNA-binding LacI/PurR family transcriptional regulator